MNPVIQIITSRAPGDCAIIALAMYLGKPYEDVLAQAAQTLDDYRVHQRGMWIRQIEQLATVLGSPLRRKRKWDWEDSDGMLCLNETKHRDAHIVVLRAGLVFDSDATVWEPDVYLAHRHYKPTLLLQKED